jgi:hypothetical protein
VQFPLSAVQVVLSSAEESNNTLRTHTSVVRCYLLIGAGFSHNWDGWLASEAFEYLLGDPAVIANDKLRTLLWKHQNTGGFEAALDELQREAEPRSQLDELQLRSAVRRMFDTMNSTFKSKGLEFRQHIGHDHPVRNFLLRFDAIFSLNQDLLLEYCYRGSKDGLVDRDDPRTERDWQCPGMRVAAPPDATAVYPSAAGIWVPSADHVIEEGEQPIFKLHGSSNWRTAEGSDIMIVGGGKAQAIARYPVLEWYSQIFTEYLTQTNANLMVIGYGFRDEHINAALTQAIDRGLRLFVVDPLGAEVASTINPVPKTAIGYKPTSLEESLRKAVIGASRRPLSSTFATDDVERQKIERFFAR